MLCCRAKAEFGDGRELLYCGGGHVGRCHPDNQQTAFWELIKAASGLYEATGRGRGEVSDPVGCSNSLSMGNGWALVSRGNVTKP